jgi:hypothetical protein
VVFEVPELSVYGHEELGLQEREHELLLELIQRRGPQDEAFALFFVTGEGTFLPISKDADPVEESSGYVLYKSGTVFSFWFGWDLEHKMPTLEQWDEVEPEAFWNEVPEYRRARERLGI